MNILTIGGSGFVSGALARLAVERGHHLWAVTRGKRNLPAGVTPIVADRNQRDAFATAVAAAGQTFDLVVDCIGYEPDDARQDIDILGPIARHLVFISTDFVYDPTYRTIPQRTDNPHFETTQAYGKNKRHCELIIRDSAPEKLRWTILRPCHIYGPGSQLGCLPLHGRDAKLIDKLRAGEPITLVGGGHFLQQPIFARDLAQVALSCAGNAKAHQKTFHVAGPDIIESRRYYQIIAELLDVKIDLREISVEAYKSEHPEHLPFLCHRVYDIADLGKSGLHVPATPIEKGLREHTQSLIPNA